MTSSIASPKNTLSHELADIAPVHPHPALRQCVEASLEQYFALLDGQPTANLYQLVLR